MATRARMKSARASCATESSVSVLLAKVLRAMALAVGAGGTVSSYTTTVLLTPEEAMQAMSEAAESLYQPAAG